MRAGHLKLVRRIAGVALLALTGGSPAAAQGLLPAWLTGAMPTGFENAAPPDLVIFSSFEADDFSRYGGAGFKWR
ncbi:MAG: hypothetical protein ACRCYS_13875, partial [Beijerinckiaceae bacterium]